MANFGGLPPTVNRSTVLRIIRWLNGDLSPGSILSGIFSIQSHVSIGRHCAKLQLKMESSLIYLPLFRWYHSWQTPSWSGMMCSVHCYVAPVSHLPCCYCFIEYNIPLCCPLNIHYAIVSPYISAVVITALGATGTFACLVL